MKHYKIIEEPSGSYEYRNGDIVGIDNRIWVPTGPDKIFVRLLNGKLKQFPNKNQAKKFVAAMNKRRSKVSV
jgi:hypothetical protein